MPVKVFCTKLCPLDFAGTTFALFSTIENLAELIGLVLGGKLG